MANYTTNIAIDFTDGIGLFQRHPYTSDTTLIATSAKVQVRTASGKFQEYTGKLTQLNDWFTSSSILTGFAQYSNAWNSEQSITGIDLSVQLYDLYYNNSDMAGLTAYLFSANDSIKGSGLNDVLRGYVGNDTIDGGAGTDTAYFSGLKQQTTLTKSKTGWLANGSDGVDTLISIEGAQFSDKTIALEYSRLWGLQYIASYPDLIAAFGTDIDAGISHYVNDGSTQGRRVSFDANLYGNLYADLKAYYKDDLEGLATHYILYGYKEGRKIEATAHFFNTDSFEQRLANISVATDIVIDFSQAIQKNSGYIVLKTASGVIIEQYNVATSPSVAIAGSSLVINPTNNLSYLTSYILELSAGVVKDMAGKGLGNVTDYYFTTGSNPNVNVPVDSSAGNASLNKAVGDQVAAFNWLLTGKQEDTLNYAFDIDAAQSDINAWLNAKFIHKYSGYSLNLIADDLINKMGITNINFDVAKNYLLTELGSVEEAQRGVKVDWILHYFLSLTQNPTWAVEANAFAKQIADSKAAAGTLSNVIKGGKQADAIQGTGFGDIIFSGDGGDNVTAGDGDDTIFGGLGNDMLYGGKGADMANYRDAPAAISVNLNGLYDAKGKSIGIHVSGDGGNDFLSDIENIEGSPFNDVLFGNDLPNILFGGDGNDSIEGGIGNDSLDGSAGNDTLQGGYGNDTLVGGEGVDTLSYLQSELAVTVEMRSLYNSKSQTYTGKASNSEGEGYDIFFGFENIYGSDFDDVISGDDIGNLIQGGKGSDKLEGGKGKDTLNGGTGNDTASYRNAGSPVAVNLSKSQTTGGDGVDKLIDIENIIGSIHADNLIGDNLSNTIVGGNGSDTIDGGLGDDYLYGSLEQYTAAEVIDGSVNSLEGGNGNDTLEGAHGNDALSGGTGNDTASYRNAVAEVTVNLSKSLATGGAGVDTLDSIENIIGSNYSDNLTGNSYSNMIAGGNGNDTIDGGLDNDSIDGGNGNDSVAGGDGDDTLSGGLGNDSLNGGSGIDTVTLPETPGCIVDLTKGTLKDSVSGLVTYALENIENINGSSYNDTLTGNDLANTIIGASGNDTLEGGLGNDSLNGGNGIDTVTYKFALSSVDVNLISGGYDSSNKLVKGTALGGAGMDTLLAIENVIGSGFNDSIVGDPSNNYLVGGLGDDSIEGGNGNDSLEGGEGVDVFKFTSGSFGNDTIVDFTPGNDVIVFPILLKDSVLSSLTDARANNSTVLDLGATAKINFVGVTFNDVFDQSITYN